MFCAHCRILRTSHHSHNRHRDDHNLVCTCMLVLCAVDWRRSSSLPNAYPTLLLTFWVSEPLAGLALHMCDYNPSCLQPCRLTHRDYHIYIQTAALNARWSGTARNASSQTCSEIRGARGHHSITSKRWHESNLHLLAKCMALDWGRNSWLSNSYPFHWHCCWLASVHAFPCVRSMGDVNVYTRSQTAPQVKTGRQVTISRCWAWRIYNLLDISIATRSSHSSQWASRATRATSG